jgi:hypothetical protein
VLEKEDEKRRRKEGRRRKRISNLLNHAVPLNLAVNLVQSCDWTWANVFSSKQLEEYQLFLLCKKSLGDISLKEGQERFLLAPTAEVDEVWHKHMLHTQAYFQMCQVLLDNFPFDQRILQHYTKSANDFSLVKKLRLNRAKTVLDHIVQDTESSSLPEEKLDAKFVSPNSWNRLIPIYVKTRTGKIIYLEIESEAWIITLKTLIMEKEGIPVA